MRFKIGEKVSFLNEVGGGTVKAYKNQQIVIVEDEGFDREFIETDLAKIHGDQSNILQEDFDIQDIAEETANHQKNLGEVFEDRNFWEIDLHTHAFMDTERGYSNGELLNRQMLEFKRFFRKACDKNIRKLIVIHGVGQGVLKSEVRYFLNNQENVDYYDADFKDYGKGATTIEISYL
ncbi:hypothetical protein CW751_03995 [Brumimicrobium salinarum]|uniref:Smr domain-containing protein n=1 Tax=Brumimicrobium salinarum TaxID=2058658 RepID=A0A2I0R535_9FLAO|nr:Smr/MutS family protein [Brumimicrobium salinarum]PKR81696.1 hypothetical protein CW751_03995 [Brumimicrobium salinarum]